MPLTTFSAETMQTESLLDNNFVLLEEGIAGLLPLVLLCVLIPWALVHSRGGTRSAGALQAGHLVHHRISSAAQQPLCWYFGCFLHAFLAQQGTAEESGALVLACVLPAQALHGN